MQQLLEFAGNHMVLVAALGAVIVFIITTEVRLRSGGARSVTAHEAVRLINDTDAILIDIRDGTEYKSAHILNARNIPLSRLSDDAHNFLKDKSRPVIVYCKTGSRTGEACKLLSAAGYQDVRQLKNGLFAWQEAGLPIEK